MASYGQDFLVRLSFAISQAHTILGLGIYLLNITSSFMFYKKMGIIMCVLCFQKIYNGQGVLSSFKANILLVCKIKKKKNIKHCSSVDVVNLLRSPNFHPNVGEVKTLSFTHL